MLESLRSRSLLASLYECREYLLTAAKGASTSLNDLAASPERSASRNVFSISSARSVSRFSCSARNCVESVRQRVASVSELAAASIE
jgi:hypothetical protein